MSVSGYNRWGQIAGNIKPACQKIVTETTLQIRDNVQANAPRRTGFMADSTYAVTPDGNSTYGQAGSPPGDSYLLPEVKPDDDTTGIIGVAANYGQFVNYGTRYMAANPFFDRGVEAGRANFEANLGQFEGLLKSGIA